MDAVDSRTNTTAARNVRDHAPPSAHFCPHWRSLSRQLLTLYIPSHLARELIAVVVAPVATIRMVGHHLIPARQTALAVPMMLGCVLPRLALPHCMMMSSLTISSVVVTVEVPQ